MTGPKAVTASFTLNQYALTTSAGTGGTVSGAGTYAHGSVASLLATADEGIVLRVGRSMELRYRVVLKSVWK